MEHVHVRGKRWSVSSAHRGVGFSRNLSVRDSRTQWNAAPGHGAIMRLASCPSIPCGGVYGVFIAHITSAQTLLQSGASQHPAGETLIWAGGAPL